MSALKKKSVVFTEGNDLLLMREVVALDPYSHPDRWLMVAQNLTKALQLSKSATRRTVQERMERLLARWNVKERESQRKTGVDENFTEYEVLLIEITGLSEDAKAAQRQVVKKKDKVNEDLEKGRQIRDCAMRAMIQKRKAVELEENGSSSDDGNPENEAQADPAGKKSGTKKIKPRHTNGRPAGDPLMEMMQRKLDLDKKKEERKLAELEERRKENRMQLQLLQLLATSQGMKPLDNES